MPLHQEESQLVGAGGLALFGKQWWKDAHPRRGAIALVHGFGEHCDRYGYLVDAVTDRGYAVFSMDLRGHGRSPGKRGHVDRFDDFLVDVKALVTHARQVAGNVPLFLFGHSMGGLIVLSYAIRYPEGIKGVIASSPYLKQANVSPLLLAVARLMARVKPDFTTDSRLDVESISRDPNEVKRYADDPLVHSLASAKLAMEMERAIRWTHEHAAALRVPVLVYHGAGDRLVPIEGSRAFIQNVTLTDKQWVEFPAGYHELHNDLDRSAVFSTLLAWLDSHSDKP